MNPKKSPTGIFDKNGKEVLHNDTIMLSCKCCFYKIVWDEKNECWHPKDDGYSQVHGKDIDVWKHEFVINN